MNGPKRYLVDTNVIVRFLVGEPPVQAGHARRLFSRAKAGEITLEIGSTVVAEAFFVLISYYKIPRDEAAMMLERLVQQRGIRLREGDVVIDTLARLQTVSVGFLDAYLAACSRHETIPVVSFDADFDKFKDIIRFDPALVT